MCSKSAEINTLEHLIWSPPNDGFLRDYYRSGRKRLFIAVQMRTKGRFDPVSFVVVKLSIEIQPQICADKKCDLLMALAKKIPILENARSINFQSRYPNQSFDIQHMWDARLPENITQRYHFKNALFSAFWTCCLCAAGDRGKSLDHTVLRSVCVCVCMNEQTYWVVSWTSVSSRSVFEQ